VLDNGQIIAIEVGASVSRGALLLGALVRPSFTLAAFGNGEAPL